MRLHDKFVIDLKSDYESDIINTVIDKDLYFSKTNNHEYYFGYKFKDNISFKDRSEFIHWIKGHKKLPNYLQEFINKPLISLNRSGLIDDIDLIIYPRSGRSMLVPMIMSSLNNIIRNVPKESIEIIKELPKDVTIDCDSLKASCIDERQYQQRLNQLENVILPKIHDLSYFSLAENVKTKYRKYIRNYLHFSDRGREILSSIQNGNVLIVDDINTSGSTIMEIMDQIHKVNPNCEVYVFTLLGN